jgi:hypothetical protein
MDSRLLIDPMVCRIERLLAIAFPPSALFHASLQMIQGREVFKTKTQNVGETLETSMDYNSLFVFVLQSTTLDLAGRSTAASE